MVLLRNHPFRDPTRRQTDGGGNRAALSQSSRPPRSMNTFDPPEDRSGGEDAYFMRLALREAERALAHDDVPIGAVLVRGGEVLAATHNERELRADPTAHAEILALREASRALGSWRLLDCTM